MAPGGVGVSTNVTFFFADFLLTQYSNSGAVCLLIMMQEGAGVCGRMGHFFFPDFLSGSDGPPAEMI